MRFLADSPSSWHAAHVVAERLVAAGFTRVASDGDWPASPGGYVMVRDGAVMAWWLPGEVADPEARILGVHTDSPAFMLKPHPSSTHPSGWGQLNVEVYGGMLPNSWLDRDLALAGRLVHRDGRQALVRTDAIARIPQLAVHLDRDQASSLSLDRQRHLRPIWTLRRDADVLDHLAHRVGWDCGTDIAGFDVMTIDAQGPRLIGAEANLLAAGRQDNLVSVFSALSALETAVASGAAERARRILVLAAFTHEEVGSNTAVGAAGPILEEVLERCAESLSPTRASLRRLIARSACLSADVAHGVHPNYADKHDPDHWPMLGGGPVLKVNATQRYATDAPGTALWRAACERAGVAHQVFVSNNAVSCGSTIAPLTATRLGIRTIDVGVPILSMHSARELSHVEDHPAMARAMGAFLVS
nr:M18 family aminopeptidase [Nanchangia anserum]